MENIQSVSQHFFQLFHRLIYSFCCLLFAERGRTLGFRFFIRFVDHGFLVVAVHVQRDMQLCKEIFFFADGISTHKNAAANECSGVWSSHVLFQLISCLLETGVSLLYK